MPLRRGVVETQREELMRARAADQLQLQVSKSDERVVSLSLSAAQGQVGMDGLHVRRGESRTDTH